MARTQLEREHEAIQQKMLERVDNYKAIYKRCDDEQRRPTAEENEEIADDLKAIELLKGEKKDVEQQLSTLNSVRALSKELGSVDPMAPRVTEEPLDRVFKTVEKSVGEVFTDSIGYKDLIQGYKESGRLRQGASTGAVSMEMKGTVLEGPGGGGGALAATVPQVVPGVVERQFQRLTVADLLMSGQASTNSLRYVVEGTATSGAAGVAEAGTKPESTLGLTTTDEPVKKIATILPISEEMLEDAPAVQSYINGRLSLFVKIEEERQLLRGAGTNEIVGLMAAARGINVYAASSGGTALLQMEGLFKAMNGQRGSALIEPDFIVINPTDWQNIRLAKDTANQYYGGGPFQGAYNGSGPMVGPSGQVTGQVDSIWGKPVVVTSALGAGTALVGTSSAAQVWRRGALSVEATNSHSNYFQLNLVAIRAEERLALAVYRPNAFTDVRLS